MHIFKRLITAIFLTVISVVLLLSATCAYLIVTPLGGKILVRYFKQEFVSIGLMHIGHYEGSLHEGFILKDVQITGLSHLPNALVRIQEIHVHLPLWDISHSDFSIFNARISIPNSDPVVFTGRVHWGKIEGNLYAGSLDLHQAVRFLKDEDIKRNLHGFISNIDLSIQGSLSEPKISGNFLADNVRYKGIFLTDGFSRMDLVLSPMVRPFQLKGEVVVDSALVNVRHTNLDLTQSKFIFKGNASNPMVNIRLGSKIEDMQVNLAIQGPLSRPQLTVSSDPPMPPQEALQVLFTGNDWTSSTSPFKGVTSGELAQDFLDYSMKDSSDQNFGLKKKLTDNLKLGVAMDQIPAPPGETNIYYSRKIEGEMDLNDHMSLNVARQVLPQESYPSSSYQDAQPTSETQIYMKYKKRF